MLVRPLRKQGVSPLHHVLGVFGGSHLDVPRAVFSRIYAGDGSGMRRQHSGTGGGAFLGAWAVFS